MRQALIVHAHPEPASFVAAMRDAAQASLMAQDWTVKISDLYKNRFDPVAHESDFQLRENPAYLNYAREQRHAASTRSIAADIAREFNLLENADLLVLTFPIYWFSTPAILKGWFDRVLLCGPIYSGRRFYNQGGLTGKRALVGAALGGREHMFGPNAIHPELTTLLSHILRGTLAYAGFSVLEPFFAYHVPYLSGGQRAKLLENWHAHVGKLDELPVLAMPSLENFDAAMKPIPPAQNF